jgi:hypothetical protein
VSDILQLAIMHVLNAVVVRLLLAAFSANYECGVPLTMGVDSLVRAILMVLRRDIWVRGFPGCGWRGSGWNRTLAVGCRTHGAEYHSDPSVRLLRPDCKAKVRARLRDWQLPEPSDSSKFNILMDNAAEAFDEFLEAAKMLAGRKGRMLPEDMEKEWAKEWAESHSKARATPDFEVGKESYAGRLSQAQYALHSVCEDSLEAIVEGCQRELFGMYGSIANMGKVRKTVEEFNFFTQDGGQSRQVKSSVLVPDKFAIPNAVSTLVLVRDIKAHYEEQGIDPDRLAEHLPTWADVVHGESFNELVQFGGFTIEPGQASRNKSLDRKEWNQRRCHRPDPQSVRAVTAAGDTDLVAHQTFEKTLSCYSKLLQCSEEAGQTQGTSKGMESTFSPITVIGKSKGPAKLRMLDGIARRGAFAGAGIDPGRVLEDEDRYWNAENLALHPGFDGWVRARDKLKGMRMDEAVKEASLPAYARMGNSFPITNHGISSRSKKYQEQSASKADRPNRARTAKRPRPALKAVDLELRKKARAIFKLASHAPARTANKGAARAALQRPPGRPRSAPSKVQRVLDQDPVAGPAQEVGELFIDNEAVGEFDELEEDPVGCPTPELRAQKMKRPAECETPSSDDESDLDIPIMNRNSIRKGHKRQKSFSTVPPQAVSTKTATKNSLGKPVLVNDTRNSDCCIERLGRAGGGSAGGGRGGGCGEDDGRGGPEDGGGERSCGGRCRREGRGGGGKGGGRRGRGGPGGRGGSGIGGRGGGRQGRGSGSLPDADEDMPLFGGGVSGRGGGGRGCGSLGGRGGGCAPHDMADSNSRAEIDDDEPQYQNDEAPLFTYGDSDANEQATKERQAAVQAGSASGAASLSTGTAKNVWGKAFCFKYYRLPCPFRPSTAIFVSASNSNPVTYEVKRNMSDVQGGNIRFPVRVAEHRMFYIAYMEQTGPILINVVQIARAGNDNDWSRTVQVYRVYQACEAVLRAYTLDDVLDDRGQVKALGRDTLMRIAAEDSKARRTTYHCGDLLFWMDVRNVVGVVRWSPVNCRGERFKTLGKVAQKLSHTDILYVGTSVAEPPPRPLPRT